MQLLPFCAKRFALVLSCHAEGNSNPLMVGSSIRSHRDNLMEVQHISCLFSSEGDGSKWDWEVFCRRFVSKYCPLCRRHRFCCNSPCTLPFKTSHNNIWVHRLQLVHTWSRWFLSQSLIYYFGQSSSAIAGITVGITYRIHEHKMIAAFCSDIGLILR